MVAKPNIARVAFLDDRLAVVVVACGDPGHGIVEGDPAAQGVISVVCQDGVACVLDLLQAVQFVIRVLPSGLIHGEVTRRVIGHGGPADRRILIGCVDRAVGGRCSRPVGVGFPVADNIEGGGFDLSVLVILRPRQAVEAIHGEGASSATNPAMPSATVWVRGFPLASWLNP